MRHRDKQRRAKPTVNQRLKASGGGGEAIPGPPIATTETEENTTNEMDRDTEETNREPSQSQPTGKRALFIMDVKRPRH